MKRIPRLWLCAALCVLLSPSLPAQEDDPWVLRFEDDFEREALGDSWYSRDARIVDGRMLVGLNGAASAGPLVSFPRDVKVEFEAEAYEGRPPCDLSLTLAANTLTNFPRNYLLAFGGANNTSNHIMGGRNLAAVENFDADKLIAPNRVYHITGIKEGKQLSMYIDDELLLRTTDANIMGGPAFDHVAMVTWNGMYVDNVRIYERVPPHPDTPDYVDELGGLPLALDADGTLVATGGATPPVREALEAYNNGELELAETFFNKLTGELRAAGLAYVYGNLYWEESPDDFPRVARLFAQLAAEHPEDERLADYAWAADKFGNVRVYPRDYSACVWLHSLGEQNNPFYDKGTLYLARFIRASGQEGGGRSYINQATGLFRELLAKAPEHEALRQLTGESIPWGAEYQNFRAGTPRWAALVSEMYARQLDIMEWWFTERQYPDGQLGGGWGDDVEILRSWGPFATISDASPAVRDGIGRLSEGVWDNLLVDGFVGGMGDVEHQAEPSADTLPTMLMLEYGNPLWFERNLASARTIQDHYTGIDETGYVRFKSGFFGGDQVSPHLRDGGDSYYSCRPMKHVLWPAWYGNKDAREFYLNWLDGWVANTMAKKYTKPAGMPPANIWYPSGDIAPPNGQPWHDPDWNIYGCCWPFNFWIQDTFLAGYHITGDPAYLQPFHAWMTWKQIPEPEVDGPLTLAENPEAWIIHEAHRDHHYLNALTQSYYRWLTDDSSYDSFIMPRATAALRLHLEGDLPDFLQKVERALGDLRYNYALHTQEVLQTDRAALSGAELSFGAYTGGVRRWIDASLPTMAVTWDVAHHRFAALVVHASEDHVRVWLYNLTDEPLPAGMHLWRLLPGTYALRQGPLVPSGTDSLSRLYEFGEVEEFQFDSRGEALPLTIPPRQEWAVDLRLTAPAPRPAELPDPAISEADLEVVDGPSDNTKTLVVTVHNLGSVEVKDLNVTLTRSNGSNPGIMATKTLSTLPACRDFVPAVSRLRFENVELHPDMTVTLDLDNKVQEIYEENNQAKLGRL